MPEAGDNYVSAYVMLPHGGTLSMGRVIERKRYADGKPVGRANNNSILDSRDYLVYFEDVEVTELTANFIAESIYAMCDPEGERVLIFDCIVYFKRERNFMTLTDQRFFDSRGKDQYYRSTKGW